MTKWFFGSLLIINIRYLFFFTIAATAIHPAIIYSKTLVIANFESGADPMSINGASSLADSGDISHVYVSSVPLHRNLGKSLQIKHLNTAAGGWLILNFGTSIDVSTNSANPFTSLSFWVRGGSGGEFFTIDLRSASLGEPDDGNRPRIKDFLPGGITTSWQKVVIPIKALTRGKAQGGLTDINGMIFDFNLESPGAETIYIDDLIFHSKTAPVMIDLFEDGADPNALREDKAPGNDGSAGTSASGAYVSTQSYSGSGSYQMKYVIGASPSWGANHIFRFIDQSTGGKVVDIGPSSNRLYFAMKKEPGTSAPNFTIELWDTAGLDGKTINTYSTLTDIWQTYSLPLTDFSGRNLSLADRISFTYGVANSSAIVYIDDIRIIDTSSPTVPTTLLRNGSAIAGSIFASTDIISVTADAGTTDTTLERVRFEHDNLTGGASWYLIGSDTDTTDSSYSVSWAGFDNLIPGTSYQIRAVSEDLSGNEGRMSASTALSLPLVKAATSFSGTAVSKTSIKWNWADSSSNESGFRVISSTGGQVSPELSANTTTWTETGLSANTAYQRSVKPFKGAVDYAASQSAIVYTLANAVASFSVSARSNSSITIAWSTATGGNGQFVLLRAQDSFGVPGSSITIATVSGNTFSYQDTGLLASTTYWYALFSFNGDLIITDTYHILFAVTTNNLSVSHTPPSSIGVLGNDVTITVSASGARTIQSATLYYRKKGQGGFTSASFSPSPSGQTYSGFAKITSSFIKDSLSVSGFEYFIAVADEVQTSSNPTSGLHSVTVSETITAPPVGSNGGTVSVTDGDPSDGETGLTIPSGALRGNTQVSVRQLNVNAIPSLNNATPVSAYEFGPSGLNFDRPVMMTLLYFDKNQDGIVDGTGVDEKMLKIFWLDGTSWRNFSGTVDTAANTVTTPISHFSSFAIFPAEDPSEQEVHPKEKIITPNNDGINDFAQFGLSGIFEILIFDPHAQVIRKLENISVWNGRKDDGNIAESGVYIYQIKSGKWNLKGTIGVAQ